MSLATPIRSYAQIHNRFLGVGTRDYYRKLGYELDGPYMSKSLL